MLTVECQAKANPAPSIIWMKENSILNISLSETEINRVTTSTIVINDFKLSNAGMYTCIAINEIGNISSPAFTVNIVG